MARPAPPDAPLKSMDYSGAAGVRYDEHGLIVPHSILGTVDDYINMGMTTGEIAGDVAKLQQHHCLPTQLGTKYSKKRPSKHPKMESVEESNALKNWQLCMAERRKQQGYLSSKLFAVCAKYR